MDDSQKTLSDFEQKMLRWANMRLNEPKLLTWDVDFMVSEGFLSVYGSKSPTCVVVPIWTPVL